MGELPSDHGDEGRPHGAPEEAFGWESCGRTHIGTVRNTNEDALLERADIGLWVVADGMGGHSAGDVASRAVTERLARLPPPGSLGEFVDDVEAVLARANRRLLSLARRRGRETIGTTVVALLAHGRHAVCVWAGDSRAYRMRGGRLEQVTQDHAFVEELVEQGLLARHEALRHPQANLITRAVGAMDPLHLDLEIVALEDGDRFLLCSDGLEKALEPEAIASVLATGSVDEAANGLIERALANEARDNVTVCVVEFRRPAPGAEGKGQVDTRPPPGGGGG